MKTLAHVKGCTCGWKFPVLAVVDSVNYSIIEVTCPDCERIWTVNETEAKITGCAYRGGAVTNVVATVGEELRPEPAGDGLIKYEEVLKHWPANNLEIRVELATEARKVWVIVDHPKSRGELHEKLKSIHGHRGETEYVLVFYDVTSNNAVRAVGNVVMPSTLL